MLISSLPSRERGLKYVFGHRLDPLVRSLPSRERGLKYKQPARTLQEITVAPFTGAWIEIPPPGPHTLWSGRSLHGSVD